MPSLLVIPTEIQPSQRAFYIVPDSKLATQWIVRRGVSDSGCDDGLRFANRALLRCERRFGHHDI